MPYFKIDSKKIHYRIKGKGIPVLLIHNGFHDSKTWKNIRKKLSKNFRVITYDRIGYGKSSKLSNFEGDIIKKSVSNLEKLLEHINIDKLHIIGHCIGGAIGFLYTLKNPRKVISITSEAVGFYGNQKTVMKCEYLYNSFEDLESKEKKLLTKMHGKRNIKKFWEISKNYKETYIMSEKYDIRNDVKSIKCPVLIINGDKDFFFNIKDAEEASKIIKDSKLWISKNTGHEVHIENHKGFLEHINSFIKNL